MATQRHDPYELTEVLIAIKLDADEREFVSQLIDALDGYTVDEMAHMIVAVPHLFDAS